MNSRDQVQHRAPDRAIAAAYSTRQLRILQPCEYYPLAGHASEHE
ncbi:hypothetical protein [Candidatus Methylacidiphilum infernorum]|nr:hypothetical protein [Candidatus Methylacidiphilum infernorum]